MKYDFSWDFSHHKAQIQADFDEALAGYPEDMSAVVEKVPVGVDAMVRKLALVNAAADLCPLYLLPHYPFAMEISCGQPRIYYHAGIGDVCKAKSGVDFSALHSLRQDLWSANLGSFNDYTDFLHSTLDFDLLLEQGFAGIYDKCEQLNASESHSVKKSWRDGVMNVCLAIKRILLRHRQQVTDRLATETDPAILQNLTRITESRLCPWEAPATFYEAMCTIMYASLLISRLDGINMSCQGPLDRLLYPFYERDIAKKRLTRDEAYYLIQCYLFRTDAHIHYSPERTNYDSGVTVMIGGLDPAGRHVYNIITDMILDAYEANRFIQPKLNARATKDSPAPYLRRLSERMLSTSNNIIVENDDYIVPMFCRMGLSLEDARRYIGGGCQEVICPNQLHSRAFVYLNLPQILLDTMRYGNEKNTMPDGAARIYRYGSFQYSDFATFFGAFLSNLRSYIQVLAETFRPFEEKHGQINPVPLLSCFTADCVAAGVDMSDGGARYNHKTLSLVGFGTLCDSLLRIRDAFKNQTFDSLWEAITNSFSENEPLRQSLLHAPDRFGHSEEGDHFAEELAVALGNVSEGIENARGIRWHTSLFTYYSFRNFGLTTGATPDGRLANTPFSRQMNMATLPDLTSAARSMARLTTADFHDVGMFDIALPMDTTGGTYKEALADYIRTCLSLQLPVLQTNFVDLAMLRAEMEHKGTHPELVVRVCGYSALFTELDRRMQEEIVNRVG